MKTIQAIQTSYKGYKFRSRLEARWAVFFDALRIEWRYETEGFKITTAGVDDSKRWFYLPDFYLVNEKCWVEVKGDKSTIDTEMFTAAVDYGGCLPHVADSGGSTRGIIFLGDIPDCPENDDDNQSMFEMVCHPILQHHKGARVGAVAFGSPLWPESVKRKEPQLTYIEDHFCGGWEYGDALGNPIKIGSLECTKTIADWQWNTYLRGRDLFNISVTQAMCYPAARSARFEHGESPR